MTTLPLIFSMAKSTCEYLAALRAHQIPAQEVTKTKPT